MAESARVIPKSAHLHLFRRNLLVLLSVAGFLWANTAVAILLEKAGYQLTTRRGSSLTSRSLLVMTLFVSAVTIFYGGHWYLRARKLAARGVPVVGTARRIVGVIGGFFLDRAEISYTFNNRAHVVKLSTNWHKVEKGQPVELLIDPAKPKRCMFREDVLPDKPSQT